jgi:uncharacterized Zn finger protein
LLTIVKGSLYEKKNMTRKRSKEDRFRELTWDNLEEWAGSTIVARGRSYQRNGHVQGLARTPNGGLAAWVHGVQRYATWVDFEEGELTSTCSCPYGATCKHAVAVVLDYLHHLKRDIEIPEMTEPDGRLEFMEEALGAQAWHEGDGEKIEDGGFSPPHAPGEAGPESLQPFLEQHSKRQLIALIDDLARRYPLVKERLRDLHDLSRGTVKKVVTAVRREIQGLSAKPGWRNPWSGEGFTPDYSRVRDRLEALLARGWADEVVGLGKELLEAGESQVEMSHDEGETAREISSCLDVVFRALPRSSLAPSEQMLWAVEAELEDEYGLCYGAKAFWKRKHTVEDWNIVAEKLMERLNHFQWAKDENGFSRDYHRDCLVDWVIHALENAGRHDEIVPLCEREAEKTGSYVRLVNYLKEAKRWEEAEQWIHRGIEATKGHWPGVADGLRTTLREMREREGDWRSVASLRAEDFFREPTVDTFQELRKAAERAGVWPAVRETAMHYLEAGELPLDDPSWPLPQVGAQEDVERPRRQFPLTDTLIDIAIAEKRPDEVIRWYGQHKSKPTDPWWYGFKDDRIAEALADRYPDRALDIWKRVAEEQIALTKPKAYQVAAGYLGKVRRVLESLGREREWQSYLAELRQLNVQKRRLMEVLDSLSGRPIVEGP